MKPSPYEKQLQRSMKNWNSDYDWDKAFEEAFGKEKLLQVRKRQYRNDIIKRAVTGVISLTAIAILCLAVLYLR